MRAFGALAVLAACKGKPATHDDPAPSRSRDAAVAPADAPVVWPELASLPLVEPLRVIALPAKTDQPRFTTGGPVLLGDLAIMSSSQFGFAAVDFRRGQIAWTKPAGLRVAPPVVVDGNLVLVGECVGAPPVPDAQILIGCARVVTPTGTDEAYIAVRGKQLEAFRAAAGVEDAYLDGETFVWRRGDQAVAVNLMSGVAKPVPASDAPLVVTYKGKTWRVHRTEDGIIEATGAPSWKTEREYGALLGAVYIPDQAPMIRAASVGRHGEHPELLLFDMDATGSLHGQVTMNPAPGIGIIGHGISKVGNTALAVRLDTSLQRDYIAGYAANASLQWAYPLPQMPRPDPVGIAVAYDAVVVFHDGDTLTVLPELSAPPTAPGAARDPSENSTP